MALPQCWLLQSWWVGMTLGAACTPHPLPQQVSPRQVGVKGSERGHQLSYHPRCTMGPKGPQVTALMASQETQHLQGSSDQASLPGGQASLPGMAQRVCKLLAPSSSPGPRRPLPSSSPALGGDLSVQGSCDLKPFSYLWEWLWCV